METAIFIARIFGITYLIVATGMLFNRDYYQKVIADFGKNSIIALFSGMFALIVGIVIVLVHNVWRADWTVIITIIGWIAIVKGAWLLVFPKTVTPFMRLYEQNKSTLTFHALAALGFGVVLTYFGFFAG